MRVLKDQGPLYHLRQRRLDSPRSQGSAELSQALTAPVHEHSQIRVLTQPIRRSERVRDREVTSNAVQAQFESIQDRQLQNYGGHCGNRA